MWSCGTRERLEGEVRCIPHLAKNERDAPNFLYAALDRTACAPFIKERRMKFREPTKLHRKSGIWGTRLLLLGYKKKPLLDFALGAEFSQFLRALYCVHYG